MPDLTDAELAIAAAAAGAAEVRQRYGGPLERHAKEGTDFATSADLASEDGDPGGAAEHRPGDAMVGEEAGRTGPSDAAREWLVDPLCGTRNFAARTPLVAVNVALRVAADPRGGKRGPDHERGVLDRRLGRLVAARRHGLGPVPSAPLCSST